MRYFQFLLVSAFLVISLFSACSDDDDDQIVIDNFTIWSGPTVTFEKASGADPDLAENQDRITNNVWITRDNDGGQIYNIATEAEADKDNSPAGTLWALGTTAEINDLTFDKFRSTIRPQNVVGRNMVLLLVEDEIAIDVLFTGWAGNQNGGFSYERASE